MDAEKERHGETDEQAVRLVLLVAMPMREKYRQILEVFGANISSDAPPIDWTSSDTFSLPRITHHLYFALHMAICVVNKSTWTDPNSTLLQKFQTAKFCEHNGSDISSKENICRCLEAWPVDSIKTIESLELLGEISLSDADVDRAFQELMANWVYGPVWWNCQDFAIRLGSLLTTTSSLRLLRILLRSLRILFKKEIIDRRKQKETKAFVALAASQWAAGLAIIPAIFIFPPAIGPLVTTFAGCTLGGLATGTHIEYWGGLDRKRSRLRRESIRKLNKEFPVLRDLHQGLV